MKPIDEALPPCQVMNLRIPTEDTLAIIMGGGAGTRLFPLTKQRAKPAVPLAGKYRLVDIPISNCINSGLRQIYVLTQFNTEVTPSSHLYQLQIRQLQTVSWKY